MGIFGRLTNMIFLNKNSNLIEIRHYGDKTNNAFFSLASAVGLNYYYEFYYFDSEGLKVDFKKLDNLLSSLM